MMKMKKVQ
jgi:hypothetical protein